MSLRDLIEAKARRTATLPIVVGDVAAAVADVNAYRGALAMHDAQADEPSPSAEATLAWEDRKAELQADLDAAIARRNACAVYVQLQAIPDDEWDAALDGLPDSGDGGGPDISSIRSTLMAASCVDEDLRDETWWAEQFAKPHWSKGELTAVNMALLHLNLGAPQADAGKG